MLPQVAVSAAVTAVAWLLLSIEGLVRGQFLAVLVRVAVAAAVLVGVYYLLVDWPIVLGWMFIGAAVLLLVVNLQDARRR